MRFRLLLFAVVIRRGISITTATDTSPLASGIALDCLSVRAQSAINLLPFDLVVINYPCPLHASDSVTDSSLAPIQIFVRSSGKGRKWKLRLEGRTKRHYPNARRIPNSISESAECVCGCALAPITAYLTNDFRVSSPLQDFCTPLTS